MDDSHVPRGKPPAHEAKRNIGSFLGWAFVISAVLHAVTLPFFGLKAQPEEKTETHRISLDALRLPTPRPPKPTPPPTPTPKPLPTAPPVHRALPPPTRRRIVVVVTHPDSNEPSHGDPKYVPSSGGNSNTGTSGPSSDASPGPQITAIAATPAPTVAPPTATPKPSCANPNAEAAIKGQAVEPVVPDVAREQGEAGTTEVEVTLDVAGTPVSVTVHKSSGFSTLDRAAVDAAKATAYTPEIVECVKTAGSYLFRADFDAQ